MNRRRFARHMAAGLSALVMRRAVGGRPAHERPQVSITIDDFNVFDAPALPGAERNRSMLRALRDHGDLKAAVFVTGQYVDDVQTMPLLQRWDEEGHLVGNHTYSHGFYPDADFGAFTGDLLRNEGLLHEFPMYRRLFRFPYLKEGNTAEQRDRMRAFLQKHGYRNGHVTIDASDWYIDGRLRDRLKQDPGADLTPYLNYYLQHLWDRARYYDALSRDVLGRSIRHTLLLHHNVLNGLFLRNVLDMFVEKGWNLIDAEEAFDDPAYLQMPDIVPAGESLVWQLARASGRHDHELRYPAEDSRYEKPQMDALGL